MDNPFKIIGEGDDRRQQGAFEGSIPKVSPGDLWTSIVVGQPPETTGETVMMIPGLWEPRIGSIIQLGEPNRNAIVYAHRYQVDGPIGSIVHVYDSMEENDFRENLDDLMRREPSEARKRLDTFSRDVAAERERASRWPQVPRGRP